MFLSSTLPSMLLLPVAFCTPTHKHDCDLNIEGGEGANVIVCYSICDRDCSSFSILHIFDLDFITKKILNAMDKTWYIDKCNRQLNDNFSDALSKTSLLTYIHKNVSQCMLTECIMTNSSTKKTKQYLTQTDPKPGRF